MYSVSYIVFFICLFVYPAHTGVRWRGASEVNMVCVCGKYGRCVVNMRCVVNVVSVCVVNMVSMSCLYMATWRLCMAKEADETSFAICK